MSQLKNYKLNKFMNKLRKSNRRKSQKYRKNRSENNLLLILEKLPKHKKLLKNNHHNKPAVNVPKETKAQQPLVEQRLPKHKRQQRNQNQLNFHKRNKDKEDQHLNVRNHRIL